MIKIPKEEASAGPKILDVQWRVVEPGNIPNIAGPPTPPPFYLEVPPMGSAFKLSYFKA